jgi:hypothetical protein
VAPRSSSTMSCVGTIRVASAITTPIAASVAMVQTSAAAPHEHERPAGRVGDRARGPEGVRSIRRGFQALAAGRRCNGVRTPELTAAWPHCLLGVHRRLLAGPVIAA